MPIGAPDLVDYFTKLERRVARLERTSSTSNNQGDPAFVSDLSITGLAIQSQQVVSYGNDYQVYITFGWNGISVDPNVITDDPFIGYYTSMTKNGTNWSAETFTDQTTAMMGPLAQGQTITFRVRAVTQKNTFGGYASVNATTTLDNTAPGQPSTPTAAPYLGQMRVFWDGKTVGGGAMPSDMVVCEIHLSTTSITFTPTVATLTDVFYPGGGYTTVTDLTYGTTYYVRLVAVDKVGNRSVSSTGTSVVPVQAADGDIASLNIGKLVAGTLSADMTVSARIKTSNAGARVELNSAGLQAFNASSIQTVNIDAATGAVDILGKFRTGASGQRIEIDSTGFGTITWYPSTGTDIAYINSPGSNALGLNSGTGGTGSGNRLYLSAAIGELMSLNYPSQAQNGGRIVTYTGGINMSAQSGDTITMGIGGTTFLNIGDTNISTGANDYSISASGTVTIAGNIPTTGNSANMYHGSGGSMQQSTSSRTVKVKIEDLDYEAMFEGIKALRPITFYDKNDYEKWNGDPEKVFPQIGLIAEEVGEIQQPLRDLLYINNIRPDGTLAPPFVAYDRVGVLLTPFVRELWEEHLQRKAA